MTKEWDKYYAEENVIPFRAQEPYYTYCLQAFEDFITHDKKPNEPAFVALGGLHPKVTQPSHFIEFCNGLFKHPFYPYVFDQNIEPLKTLDGDNFTAVQTQLENLPAELPKLSLLVCDYTTDFMSDEQNKKLNETLPNALDKNGLFIAAQDDSLLPGFDRFRTRLKYGIDTHPRHSENLTALLSNLKLVFQASTDTNTISIFSQKDSPIPAHHGSPYGLYLDEGPFARWIVNRNKTNSS